MAIRNIYRLVEDFFGEPVTPELALRVRNIKQGTAFAFAGRYRHWVEADKPQIPAKPAADLRPFIEGPTRALVVCRCTRRLSHRA